MASDKTLDMGKLQGNAERCAATLKAANTKLKQAKDAQAKADAEYQVAQKTLEAGFDQLRAATRVV